jgi:hypothetical protein
LPNSLASISYRCRALTSKETLLIKANSKKIENEIPGIYILFLRLDHFQRKIVGVVLDQEKVIFSGSESV